MAKKTNKKRFLRIEEKPLNTSCPFCKTKTEPDYKDYQNLGKYLNDRAKLLSKTRIGTCAKHQRRLSTAVKRARHLALLPYTPALG